MLDSINKKSINLFQRKIFLLLNYILPGLVVLEVIFKKGFFSDTPENLYSFILLIFWSFVLGFPYNFFDTINVEKIVVQLIKKRKIAENRDLSKIEKIRNKKETKNHYEYVNSAIQFLFVTFYSTITFIIYNYLTYRYVYTDLYNINKSVVIYFNILLILAVIFLPISFISKKILSVILKNQFRL